MSPKAETEGGEYARRLHVILPRDDSALFFFE